MQETQAIIQRVRRINEQYQHLDVAIEPALSDMKAGQSLLVRVNDKWEPYLREQWWPVSYSKELLVIERPMEVKYEPGQLLNVLGPIGGPYLFRRTLRHVLLIAYDTPPTPLLGMLPVLLANQTSVTLALLGTAAAYKTQHLPPQVEVMHGDASLEWPDRVMTVGLADQVFAVAHTDDEMLRFGRLLALFKELRAEVQKYYIFGVFRPVLPCGAGACQACMIPVRQGVKLVCLDGPAFDLTQVSLGT